MDFIVLMYSYAGYRMHIVGLGRDNQKFEAELENKGLEKEVKVVRTGCFGLCEAGPIVIVYPEGAFYSRIKPTIIRNSRRTPAQGPYSGEAAPQGRRA
jgi:hypothetical protein